jgi:glutamate synthase domain-containing protein 2
MFALGCIQALKCHKNTCPTGITTHDPRFQEGLVVEDKDKRVANYVKRDREGRGNHRPFRRRVGAAQAARRHVRIVQEDGRSIPMDGRSLHRRLPACREVEHAHGP